ncbi:hypothetical protein V2G26_000195 [Clonostachys chloroleuca]
MTRGYEIVTLGADCLALSELALLANAMLSLQTASYHLLRLATWIRRLIVKRKFQQGVDATSSLWRCLICRRMSRYLGGTTQNIEVIQHVTYCLGEDHPRRPRCTRSLLSGLPGQLPRGNYIDFDPCQLFIY